MNDSCILMLLIYRLRMGHDDRDISEAFAKYDKDGNQILDFEEQEKMKRELEEKRVWNYFPPWFLFFIKMFRFLLRFFLLQCLNENVYFIFTLTECTQCRAS